MIRYELPYDVDIEKFERAFNIKFSYESERTLGVILVEYYDDGVKPVLIWTDYREVGYLEGEKDE